MASTSSVVVTGSEKPERISKSSSRTAACSSRRACARSSSRVAPSSIFVRISTASVSVTVAIAIFKASILVIIHLLLLTLFLLSFPLGMYLLYHTNSKKSSKILVKSCLLSNRFRRASRHLINTASTNKGIIHREHLPSFALNFSRFALSLALRFASSARFFSSRFSASAARAFFVSCHCAASS